MHLDVNQVNCIRCTEWQDKAGNDVALIGALQHFKMPELASSGLWYHGAC